MPDYTYSDYVYFNSNINTTKKHHNHFILNQKPDFYITSLSKFIDDIFTLLPKLFFDKMIKKWMNSHIKVVAQLSKAVKWNRYNK